jgi:hypothetical protein
MIEKFLHRDWRNKNGKGIYSVTTVGKRNRFKGCSYHLGVCSAVRGYEESRDGNV